jgi:hypothetical protein
MYMTVQIRFDVGVKTRERIIHLMWVEPQSAKSLYVATYGIAQSKFQIFPSTVSVSELAPDCGQTGVPLWSF